MIAPNCKGQGSDAKGKKGRKKGDRVTSQQKRARKRNNISPAGLVIRRVKAKGAAQPLNLNTKYDAITSN